MNILRVLYETIRNFVNIVIIMTTKEVEISIKNYEFFIYHSDIDAENYLKGTFFQRNLILIQDTLLRTNEIFDRVI